MSENPLIPLDLVELIFANGGMFIYDKEKKFCCVTIGENHCQFKVETDRPIEHYLAPAISALLMQQPFGEFNAEQSMQSVTTILKRM